MTPIILNFGTRWGFYPRGNSTWCPTNMRVGGPQRGSGRFGLPQTEPQFFDYPSGSPVTTLAELTRLHTIQ